MKIKNKQKNKVKIPDGWEVKKLGNLFDIKRGGSPRPIDKYITDEEDGLNWLKIGDIKKGSKYINKTSSKIKKDGLKKTTLVKKGDFILSNSMSFGRPYILNIETCIHDGWLTFQNIKEKELDRSFLYFLLLHPKVQNEFKNISAGSGVQNLKKETVSEVLLQFPPLSEQKRIVAVLEVWDEVLEKLKRKIEIKKNIKKGLLQKMLTCKKQIIGGKEIFAPELRVEGFAGGWVEKKLGEVIVQTGKKNKDNNIKRVLAVSNKYGITEPDNLFSKRVASESISNYKIIYKNEFAYNPSRINVGSIAMLEKYNFGVLSPMYIIFKTIEGVIDRKFFYELLSVDRTKASISNMASGSVRQSVDFKSFSLIKINLPTLKEQKAIAAVLTAADEEIEELLCQQKLLEDQKKYLLNTLISGEIRVPEGMGEQAEPASH